MVNMGYVLQIFAPGVSDKPWKEFSSETTFMAINPGHIIDTGKWTDLEAKLRVIRVEHVVEEADPNSGFIYHTIRVYTEDETGGPLEVGPNLVADYRG